MSGVRPSFNMVTAEVGASRPTVRKRLRRLSSLGYLNWEKQGNRKLLSITDHGRKLLHS